MGRSKVTKLAEALNEQFSDVWKLLSDTENFLSRTRLYSQYEAQLRGWRRSLQRAPKNRDVAAQVKGDLVSVRKGLRLQGYDLSLGTQMLVFDGFRNDSCLRYGYKRLVLAMADSGVYHLTGDDNHIVLCGFLDDWLEKMKIWPVRERHFLWYRRNKNELVLSGSDTETKDNFNRLEQIGSANPLLLLSALKGLR
jgi:hypothetical protein